MRKASEDDPELDRRRLKYIKERLDRDAERQAQEMGLSGEEKEEFKERYLESGLPEQELRDRKQEMRWRAMEQDEDLDDEELEKELEALYREGSDLDDEDSDSDDEDSDLDDDDSDLDDDEPDDDVRRELFCLDAEFLVKEMASRLARRMASVTKAPQKIYAGDLVAKTALAEIFPDAEIRLDEGGAPFDALFFSFAVITVYGERFLSRWRSLLKPGGQLFYCSIVNPPFSCREGSLVPESEDAFGQGDLMQDAGFEGPVLEKETLNFVYTTKEALIDDISHVIGIRLDPNSTAAGIFARNHLAKQPSRGKYSLSFDVLYARAFRPEAKRPPRRGPSGEQPLVFRGRMEKDQQ